MPPSLLTCLSSSTAAFSSWVRTSADCSGVMPGIWTMIRSVPWRAMNGSLVPSRSRRLRIVSSAWAAAPGSTGIGWPLSSRFGWTLRVNDEPPPMSMPFLSVSLGG